MKELFLPMVGNDLYEISNHGRVRNVKTRHFKKQFLGHRGYWVVSLAPKRAPTSRVVHKLVAMTFLRNINKYPEINHKDGNKLNNNVENLEWCTRSQNIQHAYNHGLISRKFGEKNGRAKLTKRQVDKIREIHKTSIIPHRKTAVLFGVSKSTIDFIVRRKSWDDNAMLIEDFLKI